MKKVFGKREGVNGNEGVIRCGRGRVGERERGVGRE